MKQRVNCTGCGRIDVDTAPPAPQTAKTHMVCAMTRALAMAFVLLVAAAQAAQAAGIVRPRVAEPAIGRDGDIATLAAKYPEGTWLPVDLLGLRLRTTIAINGVPTSVILDTGAQATLLSKAVAHRIGLDGPLVVKKPIEIIDANRRAADAVMVEIDAVTIGSVRVRGVRAIVADVPDDLVLLGYDVLAHVDLFFALDEGIVGVFAPGKGPVPSRAKRVAIATLSRPGVPVPLDDSGRTTAAFMIDTGSPTTTLRDVLGDDVGLPLDTRFRRTVSGMHSRTTTKGAYRLERFQLGRERIDLGRVYAIRGELSLLGNDVTMRHRAMLSSERATLDLAGLPIRPPTRTLGPDGAACASGPCARVAVDVTPANAPCLRVDIDSAWRDRVIEGLVDVLDQDSDSAVGGGLFFFHVRVPDDGVHVCLDVDGALSTWKVPAKSTTSLLRFHTRADTGCGAQACFGFTGLTVAPPPPPPPPKG